MPSSQIIVIKTKKADRVKLYLNNLERTLSGSIDVAAKGVAGKIVEYAQGFLSDALERSAGATGKLASQIARKRESNRGNWRYIVGVFGSAEKYAAEVENREGLPAKRKITGPLKSWVERVAATEGKTPLQMFPNKWMTVGKSLKKKSLYGRWPKGVRYMERAFRRSLNSDLTQIDKAVDKGIKSESVPAEAQTDFSYEKYWMGKE